MIDLGEDVLLRDTLKDEYMNHIVNKTILFFEHEPDSIVTRMTNLIVEDVEN
jgi:hypothetical protein